MSHSSWHKLLAQHPWPEDDPTTILHIIPTNLICSTLLLTNPFLAISSSQWIHYMISETHVYRIWKEITR